MLWLSGNVTSLPSSVAFVSESHWLMSVWFKREMSSSRYPLPCLCAAGREGSQRRNVASARRGGKATHAAATGEAKPLFPANCVGEEGGQQDARQASGARPKRTRMSYACS